MPMGVRMYHYTVCLLNHNIYFTRYMMWIVGLLVSYTYAVLFTSWNSFVHSDTGHMIIYIFTVMVKWLLQSAAMWGLNIISILPVSPSWHLIEFTWIQEEVVLITVYSSKKHVWIQELWSSFPSFRGSIWAHTIGMTIFVIYALYIVSSSNIYFVHVGELAGFDPLFHSYKFHCWIIYDI